MDRLTISENLSLWIRTISGAIGVLILIVFVLWNNENEKITTQPQETKTHEMQKVENLPPDEAPDEAESEKKLKTEKLLEEINKESKGMRNRGTGRKSFSDTVKM